MPLVMLMLRGSPVPDMDWTVREAGLRACGLLAAHVWHVPLTQQSKPGYASTAEDWTAIVPDARPLLNDLGP